MNEHLLRLGYEEWRKRERLRHTDNLLAAYAAGYDAGASSIPELAGLDDLPDRKRDWVLSMIQSAIDIVKREPME